MWKDPIVQDVRNARKLLEKDFGPDEDAYLRHIYAQQKKNKVRLVSRSSKKPYARKAA
jgi:hypothetical protein